MAAVLDGRMPAGPSVAAIRLHGDVAQAVTGGSPEQARQAMTAILEEAMAAIEQAFPSS